MQRLHSTSSQPSPPSSLPVISGECFAAGVGVVPRPRDVEIGEPGADARPCLPNLGLGVVEIVAGAAVVSG